MARRAALSGAKRTKLGIRHDEPIDGSTRWCWRPDWTCGAESIYCLLSHFQLLNVVSVHALSDAFARTGVDWAPRSRIRMPTIDLNGDDRFDTDAFMRATGLRREAIREGFPATAFPHSRWAPHASLRWCPRCAASGLHATLFQVPGVFDCPAHRERLRSTCPQCRSPIPYKLVSSSAVPLFACPSCKHDLLGRARTDLRRIGGLPKQDYAALLAKAELLTVLDALPSRFDGVLAGVAHARPADAIAMRRLAGFLPAAIESVTAIEAHRGVATIEPTFAYVDASTPTTRRPARLSKLPAEAVGWPASLVPASDRRLYRAAQTYRAVRRYLRRSEVGGHRRCVAAVCDNVWWPTHDRLLPSMCPRATAFIRWRMMWESMTSPRALRARPTCAPLGLIGWIASAAPIGASTWTESTDEWLSAHVLGLELIASFRGLLIDESKLVGKEHAWSRRSTTDRQYCCWVCAGRGSNARPIRLFVDVSAQRLGGSSRASRQHVRDVRDAVGAAEP